MRPGDRAYRPGTTRRAGSDRSRSLGQTLSVYCTRSTRLTLFLGHFASVAECLRIATSEDQKVLPPTRNEPSSSVRTCRPPSRQAFQIEARQILSPREFGTCRSRRSIRAPAVSRTLPAQFQQVLLVRQRLLFPHAGLAPRSSLVSRANATPSKYAPGLAFSPCSGPSHTGAEGSSAADPARYTARRMRPRAPSRPIWARMFSVFPRRLRRHGNVLDLWAAVHRLPLHEAALLSREYLPSATEQR